DAVFGLEQAHLEVHHVRFVIALGEFLRELGGGQAAARGQAVNGPGLRSDGGLGTVFPPTIRLRHRPLPPRLLPREPWRAPISAARPIERGRIARARQGERSMRAAETSRLLPCDRPAFPVHARGPNGDPRPPAGSREHRRCSSARAFLPPPSATGRSVCAGASSPW